MIKYLAIFLAILMLPYIAYAQHDELVGFLEKGSADRGKKLFNQCKACHTIEKNGRHKVGPNLYKIIGKKAGSNPTYGNYSEAMKNSDITWSYETLDAYLKNSKKFIPRNRMPKGRMADPQDRADIILYLRKPPK